ncbi:Tetratricopeptide-like_helical domain superfamily [Hexamita inflata]|uniref:Tetratricopeptide-like helical domain superfamily n=1 Tax=Hexamita inflata TaxID=28002 RepID=A0AA86TRS5_9EUKA|nr:Tetratricopeptide-like helical domain superfamily [Hexamita inflata]
MTFASLQDLAIQNPESAVFQISRLLLNFSASVSILLELPFLNLYVNTLNNLIRSDTADEYVSNLLLLLSKSLFALNRFDDVLTVNKQHLRFSSNSLVKQCVLYQQTITMFKQNKYIEALKTAETALKTCNENEPLQLQIIESIIQIKTHLKEFDEKYTKLLLQKGCSRQIFSAFKAMVDLNINNQLVEQCVLKLETDTELQNITHVLHAKYLLQTNNKQQAQAKINKISQTNDQKILKDIQYIKNGINGQLDERNDYKSFKCKQLAETAIMSQKMNRSVSNTLRQDKSQEKANKVTNQCMILKQQWAQ